MKLNLFYFVATATMMFGFCACGNDSPDINPNDNKGGETVIPNGDADDIPEPKAYTTLNLTSSQEAAKQANNDFAVSLMKDVMEMQNGESTVISPFSLYSTLSMSANGDTGKTRDQILRVLGFDTGIAGLEGLNDFNSLLISQLPQLDSRAYALVSNSMWFGNNTQLLPDFISAVTRWYGADVKSLLTLNDDNARQLINQWCSEKTKGLIPEFLKNNLDCQLALLNATYFRGMWTNGFNKDNTSKAPFTNIDGTTAQVDLMSGDASEYLYAKNDVAEIVGLPYGNGNFRMMCILPNRGYDITAYTERMTAASLSQDFANTKETKCIVRMPKFDIGSNQDITRLLKSKGLDYMFDYGFNAIASDGSLLKVTQVLQETRVSTDEGGTLGAAVTMMGIDSALNPDAPEFKPVEITLDRPFLFMIEETSTGTILFIGAVFKL